MNGGQNAVGVRGVFHLQPLFTVVRVSHFVIGPTTGVTGIAGVGDVDGEMLVQTVGDSKVEPLGVLFFIGTW